MAEREVVGRRVRVLAGTEEGTQQELACQESSFISGGRAYLHHHHRGSTRAAANGTADDGTDETETPCVPLKVSGNCFFS